MNIEFTEADLDAGCKAACPTMSDMSRIVCRKTCTCYYIEINDLDLSDECIRFFGAALNAQKKRTAGNGN